MKNCRIGRGLCLWFPVVVVLSLSCMVHAAPMDGQPIEYTQPNGTVIHLQVFGDEFYAETRTLDGYTVFFDTLSKTYYYAVLSADGTEFLSSGIEVGITRPHAGLPKQLSINPESKRAKIRKRIASDEFEQERAKRWKSIKDANREKRQRKALKIKGDESSAPLPAAGETSAAPTRISEPAPPSSETTGTRVGLTILVEFPDEAGTIGRQEVDNYCNEPGYTGFGNAGSIYDYFYTQSEGKLRYYNVVTPYVMAPHPKAYYDDITQDSGYCGRLLLNDVLQELIASGFDFSHCTVNASGRLDAINMFFAGPSSGVWNKGLWPHKYELSPDVDLGGGIYADQYQTSNMGSELKIGTFCHENGHLLCSYPDVYDYDEDSNGAGYYSLMAYFGFSTHPISIDGYLRYHSGWVETVNIDTNSHLRGCVRVDAGSLYLFANSGNASEYFLVDNREKIGWEHGSFLGDEGLLIMHCDEGGNHNSQEMTDSNHYELSIEQADGLFELEYLLNLGRSGDLFHNGDKDSFTDFTLPNAHWWANATTNPASGDASGLDIHDISPTGETMTFIVGSGALSGSSELGVDRTLLEPSAFSGAVPMDVNVAVWNRGAGTLNYSVTPLVSWIEPSVASGSASNNSDIVTLSFSTNDLVVGINTGAVIFVNTDNPADTHTLSVRLTVEAEPTMATTPDFFSTTLLAGEAANPVYMLIRNDGGGELTYTTSGWTEWASATPTNGSLTGEADPIEIVFDATSLPAGSYTAMVSIVSSEATDSPYQVPLYLSVKDVFLDPLDGNVFTNHQTMAVSWQYASNVHDYVDIELWHNGVFDSIVADNIVNDGHFDWTIPYSISVGTNYTLRIHGDGSLHYDESAAFSVLLYFESFESGRGGWIESTTDDFDWTRWGGETQTSGTGPSLASDGIYYLYTESSIPNSPSKMASLTRQFDFSTYSGGILEFDYHMFGSSMGSLYVDIFDGLSWTMEVWSLSGQQQMSSSDPWKSALVDLSDWMGLSNVTIRFRGVTGSGFLSDMAIDNIRLFGQAAPVASITLVVESAHGNPSPSVGAHEFVSGTVVTASVENVIESGATQYVCTGWSMTGQEPASGSSATNIITLTNNATLTWNWDTNYYFDISADTNGTVDQTSQWVAMGSPLEITATPEPYYHFDMWDGDVSGSVNPISVTSDAPKTVIALFGENVVTNDVPEWWLAQYGFVIDDDSALVDSDLDTMLNWQEFVAGTNPTNNASLLEISNLDLLTNGFVVGWQAVEGKSYRVLVWTNLIADSTLIDTNGIPGVEPESSYTGITEGATAVFIKVGVEP